MDTQALIEAGLTPGEVKVYLALLRLGATKTGSLAKSAEVSSSKVYKILDRLETKGLAGHIIVGKIKHYKALEPRRILDYLEEKENQLRESKSSIQQLLPVLEQQMLTEPQEDALVYQGFKAVSNFFRNILDELKAGDTYHVIGAVYREEIQGMRPFFQNYHLQRGKKKIKVKMLANESIRNSIVPATKSYSEIRFLPGSFITNMQITFYKEKAFIVLWTQNPKGFLIKSEEAVKNFRSYFDAFWKIAKP